jgi:hypothetical protein
MNPDAKPPTKRRPWFQFHLSTCVILMFVAGGLLWANVTERGFGAHFTSKGLPYVVFGLHPERGLGWPLPFLKWDWEVGEGELSMHFVSRLPQSCWSFVALAADLAVALAVLALVGLLCEWRIRRSAETPSP